LLRFRKTGIIFIRRDNNTADRVVEQEVFQVCSVWVVSNQMETPMHRATIIGTLAILAAALLISGRAEAGASASAPSKYAANTTKVAVVNHANRQALRSGFPITEYSSSSARTHAPKYR
jgi:hypothetical protein